MLTCSKFNEKGVTLIEIIVSVFLIVVFSSIIIVNFPRIQATFSLSGATYRFAQDLRRVQDLSLSGAEYINENGQKITIAGYGIYIDKSSNNKQYKLYADSCIDQAYTPPDITCPTGDAIIDIVNIGSEQKGVNINGFTNINGDVTSINFTPPNPSTTIQNIIGDSKEAEIIFSLDQYPSQTRKVLVNKLGLIEVK